MPRAKPDTQRVSVAQAATELGIDPMTLRFWIRKGKLPIGRFIPGSGGRRGTYLIYRGKLDQELGRVSNEEGKELRRNG